jgi:hypothetical protein
MSDLERAFAALKGKLATYNRYFDYYDGDQPVLYTAKRLEEIFKGIDAVFTENWCTVVIDSTKDRINLEYIQMQESMQARWDSLWERSRLKLESDDVHESALITGESFVVVWQDGEGLAQAYFTDPRLCHVFYQTENPREVEFAAKWWKQEDGVVRMTLYYGDRLAYYSTQKKVEEETLTVKSFKSMGADMENPFGEVPVFHFRTSGRKVKSDLKSVVPVQNGINKLLADMMVAAEYGAFKQRYIISNSEIQGKLKNAPNEIWDLPAGDGMSQQTQAGQFDATPLKNYLDAIDNLSMSVSSITRTPKHYFFSIGSNLSGEALIAMEAPLNKKAQDRIDRFIPVWRDVARFMLKVEGVAVDVNEIEPVFEQPESVQPFTEAQSIQMMVSAGIPLKSAARRMGWTMQEINQLEMDLEEDRAFAKENLANSLMNSLRSFDGGEEE